MIFAILIILLLFFIIPLIGTTKKEHFTDTNISLLNPLKTYLYQGTSVPLTLSPIVGYREHEMPSVDGQATSPKDLFMFAYNQCRPECCHQNEFSCNGGCICITRKQKHWVSQRGHNSSYS